ncbi:MAG: hypothetical protein R3C40_07860 [Parvularculaceae bacterium]
MLLLKRNRRRFSEELVIDAPFKVPSKVLVDEDASDNALVVEA